VVLRFNLSTAAEEKALAEAADTLFLDVWEFTNNWADIRLREDDVGARSRYYDQILIVYIGSLAPWIATKVIAKGLLQSDARSSEDYLPILSLDCLRRTRISSESRCLHTSSKEIRWS